MRKVWAFSCYFLPYFEKTFFSFKKKNVDVKFFCTKNAIQSCQTPQNVV